MKILLILLAVLLTAGCGNGEKGADENLTELQNARRRGIFWQFEKPKIQLDPIEEEETPSVIRPVEGE